MNFTARILSEDGTPLARATADVVVPENESDIRSAGTGQVERGELLIVVEKELGPVWGILIDERPIAAVVVEFSGDTVDLGEIVLIPDGIVWSAFHAPEGIVYGVPRSVSPQEADKPAEQPASAPAADTTTQPTAQPTTTSTFTREILVDEVPVIRTGMTFGNLFGSTAQQLSTAVTDPTSSVIFTGANVTLKGVATADADRVALEFPTSDLSGQTLSELSFSIRPRLDIDVPPPAPIGPAVPNVGSYTRELALRKLTAAGFAAEVNHEIVADAARAGRVIRQVPASGTLLPAGEVVRIFVGKYDGP